MQRHWSQVGWRWLRGCRARTRRRSRRLPTARPILARKGRTRSMDGVSSAEIAEINFLKPITCKLFCRAMDEIRIGCRCRNEGRIKRPAFLTKETENASFNSCPSDWRQRLDRLRGTGLSPAAGSSEERRVGKECDGRWI